MSIDQPDLSHNKSMTNHERECMNVLDGLQDARLDWLEAEDELDRDRQMIAIDALLDTGLKMGLFVVSQTIDKPASV